jgi:ribonucleotide monophosphatase NagD (HAD superfamily)
MKSSMPAITTAEYLLQEYSVLLLDAYGVLIHQEGTFPEAPLFITRLNSMSKPYFVLTNDASAQPETLAALYQRRGLAIAGDHVITPGSVLKSYFADQHLAGARCVALGTQESYQYVVAAGGELASLEDSGCDVLIICTQEGYPFLETVEAVLTMLFRKLDACEPMRLLLLDPD